MHGLLVRERERKTMGMPKKDRKTPKKATHSNKYHQKPSLEDNVAVYAENSRNKMQNINVIQRRSQRFRKQVLPSQDRDTELMIEDLEASGSDGYSSSHCEKKRARVDECAAENVEDETDYLILLLDQKEKVIEQLKSQLPKQLSHLCSASSKPSKDEINALVEKKNKFRNLYIDCHKKLDVLTEENHQLSKQLEALGKLEPRIAKLEQTFLVSSLTKSTKIRKLGPSSRGSLAVKTVLEDDNVDPPLGGKRARNLGKKR